MFRIAVVGSGIGGLSAAWHLKQFGLKPVLFEAGAHFGGHANTVDVTLDGITHGVDTGFLVYNERTYPGLIGLFEALGVGRAPSSMSFSVMAPRADGGRLEWSGNTLDTVFAQRRNLLSPRFWTMLRDLMRFNRLTTELAQRGDEVALQQTVGEFLTAQGFSDAFRDDYFLPMVACIWSCPTEQMLRFPMATMIRFCHNHGLLQISHRPQWYTVPGGSREYVRRLVAQLPDARLNSPVLRLQRDAQGVVLHTHAGAEHFDGVVLACHSNQALALLDEGASEPERQLLGAIRYQPNVAVLHTDPGVLPTRRKVWAAWNYERAATEPGQEPRVCLHYLINELQPLPWQRPVIVSLNPLREPAPDQVLARIDYEHPVFDLAAIQAQVRLDSIQGHRRTWFAGAWCGYGFHEDGFQAGRSAAQGIQTQLLDGLGRASEPTTRADAQPAKVA